VKAYINGKREPTPPPEAPEAKPSAEEGKPDAVKGKVLVIGAGPAGLAAALQLKASLGSQAASIADPGSIGASVSAFWCNAIFKHLHAPVSVAKCSLLLYGDHTCVVGLVCISCRTLF